MTESGSLLITGGHFAKHVYAGSGSISTNTGTVTVEAKDGDIFFGKELLARSASESIALKGGAKKILVDADSKLVFGSYDGTAQTVEQTESFTAGHAYLTVPSGTASGIAFQGTSEADGVFTGA